MAEGLERPGEGPGRREGGPHLPPPTIWPAAFAAGIALVLVGLIVNWVIVAVGAVLAIVFGYLWVRDVTQEVRRPPVEELPPAAVAVHEDTLVEEEAAPEEEQYTRSKFLGASTLGLGAVIGGVVTIPVLGFAVGPAFIDQEYRDVDLGPLSNFPEGEWRVTTFFTAREAASVGLRTAFIRNNGLVDGVPSMTIISSRCAHVGCPVQPSGPRGEPEAIETESGRVTLISTQPSGFVCPCHGGAYDLEGNRTAGPPVRALDRYRYSIAEGNLVLNTPYSVGHVEDEGKEARIHAYRLVDPGQHVDGPEQIFYPYVP